MERPNAGRGGGHQEEPQEAQTRKLRARASGFQLHRRNPQSGRRPKKNDEPSTPSPKPPIKPIQIASMIEVVGANKQPDKNASANGHQHDQTYQQQTQYASAPLKEEVIAKLNEFINFMEAVHTIEDNMANLQGFKGTVIEAANAAKEIAKTAPHTWATVAAKPPSPKPP